MRNSPAISIWNCMCAIWPRRGIEHEPRPEGHPILVARDISADAVRRHYEIMSLPYRLFWGQHLHHGLFFTGRESPQQAQVQLLDYCCQMTNIRKGARVLDVGCGYGGTAIYLARNFGCAVDGLTLSPKQAYMARRKIFRAGLDDRTKIVVCDAERFEIRGHYDLIWMMESSEHLRDKRGYIEKVAQSLRREGAFVLAAWTGSMTAPLVRKLAQLTVCPGFQTAEDYEAQLRSAGLAITAIRDLTQAVLPTWEICRQRVERVRLILRFLPAEIQEFVQAISLMLEAYRRRLMSYTVIVGEK